MTNPQGESGGAPAPDNLSFLNPYTFIATPSRPETGPLTDQAPPAHGRYERGFWSGSITLKLEAVTPWLVPDTARRTEARGGSKHFEYDVRTVTHTGPAGEHVEEPLLPVASVKGALRSAFETVTNSRFGVFNGHDRRMGYRMAAPDGLRLVPARVDDAGNLVLLLGTNKGLGRQNGNRPWNLPTLPAAWLPAYSWQNRNGPRTKTLPEWIKHGMEVRFTIELAQRSARRWNRQQKAFGAWGNPIKFASVTLIKHPKNQADDHPPTPRHYVTELPDPAGRGPNSCYQKTDEGQEEDLVGWIFLTNANIKNKHDERVFFGTPVIAQFPKGLDLTTLAEFYDDVCESYRNAHSDDDIWNRKNNQNKVRNRKNNQNKVVKPWEYLPNGSPGKSAWSPHLYDPDRATMFKTDHHHHRVKDSEGRPEVKEGFLCYARINGKNEVDGLFPVNIARDLWPTAPQDLLDKSLRPATNRSELSPADRVFGWVADGRVPDGTSPAERGRLRIRKITCSNPPDAISAPFDPPLPLAILGAPKPTQVGFYVGTPDGRPRAATNGPPKRTAYSKANALRGRKVYWHQAQPASYWHPSANLENGNAEREYVRQPEAVLDGEGASQFDRVTQRYENIGAPKRDRQNRSVKRWVAPGATFTVDIDVWNLSTEELGALLYLASLEKGCALHVGGGKPLGFGSARLSVARTDVHANAELALAFAELREPGPPSAVQHFIDAFKGAANEKLLATFETTTQPQPGPVHYPRVPPPGLTPGDPVPPDPQGRSYKWFTNHQGIALPAPDDPPGRLPY